MEELFGATRKRSYGGIVKELLSLEVKVLVGPLLLSAANSDWLFLLRGGVYMYTSPCPA